MTTARELMSPNPTTIAVEAPVREAARLLDALDIRHLPVVDEGGRVVGMLSDRDLPPRSAPYFVGEELRVGGPGELDAPVSEIMSGGVLSVRPEADASDVVGLLLENRIGAVPVVSDDGAVLGIVSYVDLLRALPLRR